MPADFTHIYRTHFRLVCRLLRRWGVASKDLEDAAHDVFVVVHRRLETFDASTSAEAWLAAIAYRVASDWRRRAFQRQDLSVEMRDVVDTQPSALDRAQDREALSQVEQVLELLDEDQRTVFVLHEMEGHPIPALAQALDVPLNTLYSRLRLARQRFVGFIRQVRREATP
ncbi:MAG: sigma-70 family RNA polymerase sigma factor [Myxococcota bacterium]